MGRSLSQEGISQKTIDFYRKTAERKMHNFDFERKMHNFNFENILQQASMRMKPRNKGEHL